VILLEAGQVSSSSTSRKEGAPDIVQKESRPIYPVGHSIGFGQVGLFDAREPLKLAGPGSRAPGLGLDALRMAASTLNHLQCSGPPNTGELMTC
jgi:hypothetical protein